MKSRPIIIGIGELLWDILPTGKHAGGAPINFVYHASKLGADSYAITAIGNDPLGDEIMKKVDDIGINHIIERVPYPTGTVIVDLKDGIPEYTINEGVAWDYIPLTNEMKELAKRADAICFGTLAQRSEASRTTIHSLLSLVPDTAYRILDINLRQHYYSKEIITTSLKYCNILKMNDEELELIIEILGIEADNNNDACKYLIKTFNLKFLILTAGADYSAVFTMETSSLIKTPKVNVIDTIGAGDSFTGSFISSILKGKTLKEAHQDAVNMSAHVCTKAGAWV